MYCFWSRYVSEPSGSGSSGGVLEVYKPCTCARVPIVPTKPAAVAPTAAPMALLRSDLRLKLLLVPTGFSALPLDEAEGLRIFDMGLLYPVRIDVRHKQTSSKYLRRI